MGWTGLHRDKGMSNNDFFTRELFSEGSGTIVECSTIGGTFYAAVRSNKGKYEGEVWGLVVLMQYNGKDYYNFSYKEMSEDMEPYYYNCPKRVLDKLTPAKHDGAIIKRFKVVSLRPARFAAEGDTYAAYRMPKRIYEKARVVG
jgi:hypothetical protein